MEFRQLPNTDLQISRLGLGGIPVQRSTKEEARELLFAAREAGLNFIDTARGYSISEELIGQGLGQHRSSFILATKSMQRTKEGMVNDIKTSLNNLATDYIDIYQLHNLRTRQEWELATAAQGALAALQDAQKAGLIKHIGITSHSAEIMAEALESGIFVTMMLPYNVVENQNRQLFVKAKDKSILTLAMKPVAGGFIPDVNKALRYLAGDPAVDCVLVGMGTPAEIMDNLQAIEQGPLSREEKKALEDWAADAGQDFCRRCGYCLPCPQGIDIPTVFLLEGYYDRYELQGWALDRFASLPVSPDQCAACGQCTEKCPYSLPIPAKLASANQKLAR